MSSNKLPKNLFAFKDGNQAFGKLTKEYKTHKFGLFILAPSGSGKTYFVNNQKEKHWIDGDYLWHVTGVFPDSSWWAEGLEVINEVEQRADIITIQAKKLGMWVIGTSNFWLMPDAIVLPDWRINKRNIRLREQGNYDGGAKSGDFDQVLFHRKYMKKIAREHKIPIYKTIEEAEAALVKKYKKVTK